MPRDYKIHHQCFIDNYIEALAWLDDFPNCYLGIPPVVTHSASRGVMETLRFAPINRILIETNFPSFATAIVSIKHT